jgi:transaldolase
MKLFLDSAKLEEIKEVKGYGILDGVTTNPSLIKKAVDALKKDGKKIDMEGYIKKILKVCGKLPVSLEVVGTSYSEMVAEGKVLHKKFGSLGNVYVKIPVDPCMENVCKRGADGIKAIAALRKLGIKINCTLIFSPEQAMLASKAGANYVSPFMGREDDYIREVNRVKFEKTDYFPEKGFKKQGKLLSDKGIVSGVDLVEECVEILKKSGLKTKVLAASVRNVRQFREAAEAGAHIATVPLSVIRKLLVHEKTRQGMKKFTKDVVPEYAKLLSR